MAEMIVLLAQSAPANGAPSGLLSSPLPMMIVMVALFYLLLIHPMRSKQKKLDTLVKSLKSGDRVIINPGIFATIVSVEEDALVVRIDDKAKMRILKTAVAGHQPSESGEDKEKK
jgi:preprotein translocase subunit YajC